MVGLSLATYRYMQFKKIHQRPAADAKISAQIKAQAKT